MPDPDPMGVSSAITCKHGHLGMKFVYHILFIDHLTKTAVKRQNIAFYSAFQDDTTVAPPSECSIAPGGGGAAERAESGSEGTREARDQRR